MDHVPCHCLLCQDPVDEGSWDARDRGIADKIRRFGWNVYGVPGDGQGPGWAYSIGLWHTLRSPEVCVFGVPVDAAMQIVNIIGDQVRGGAVLEPDERRSDVIDGYDLAIRAVHPAWYRLFFGAGVDFYQRPPLPMVQALWPDKQHRFPWDAEAAESCRQRQPLLWMPPGDHPPGVWTSYDPYAGWPFRTSLPYFEVDASPGVVAGTASVAAILRGRDGRWCFLDGEAGAAPSAVTTLRHILDTHPGVSAVADLAAGQRADRDPDGRWTRSTLPT